MSIRASGYFFVEPKKSLERREFEISSPQPDECIVQVAGCGVCHTDLGFYKGEVKTKMELPLVLGHEISGRVVEAGTLVAPLLGKSVVIPAVLPCGECELCRAGRDNICQKQKMPGNDFHGGFATHIKVPGRFLCEVPENLGGLKLSDLSVIADAVTTPYQSMKRSGLATGDLAIVIGAGGIGTYMVQHAKNVGARVLALDIDDSKLTKVQAQGADFTLNTRGLAEKDIKDKVRELVATHKLPKTRWKVFEMSGTAAGQNTAFSLLSFAGTLGIVGFTMEKLNLRLSNVMAFDADIFGNWGCRPAYYHDVVRGVVEGKIRLQENIETHPLSQINEIFGKALEHKLEKRAILVP